VIVSESTLHRAPFTFVVNYLLEDLFWHYHTGDQWPYLLLYETLFSQYSQRCCGRRCTSVNSSPISIPLVCKRDLKLTSYLLLSNLDMSGIPNKASHGYLYNLQPLCRVSYKNHIEFYQVISCPPGLLRKTFMFSDNPV
jgi:hypothetical protein